MATFYGSICGNRGEATRGGSKNSGFKATAQSWDGSVITYLSYNENNELMVSLSIADNSSSYGTCYFYGTIEELKKKLSN